MKDERQNKYGIYTASLHQRFVFDQSIESLEVLRAKESLEMLSISWKAQCIF